MRIGDLVEYKGGRWFVLRNDSQTRLSVLVNGIGQKEEVPDTLEEDPEALRVVANPATEWKLLATPVKRNAGPIVGLLLPPDRNRPRPTELVGWVDWIASDPFRSGGSLLLRPDLPVRKGDVLIATFQSGLKTRVTIPPTYATVEERRAAVAAPKFVPQEEANRFNRDLFEDD